ncbi:mitochondrial carrier [Auriculariales sp. MPI-PUGE-AT-0066]|nr:mitochondrial carrier [Auriculariales sp. MPI-PUGE-AT-0066]
MASLPTPPLSPVRSSWLPAKSSQHLLAGGLGGMCGAIITSPFDVVKTRLQSSMFAHTVDISVSGGSLVAKRTGGLLYNFVETGYILKNIYVQERPVALFRGLGPTLVGVIPARSISFFMYGNGKQIIANKFNDGKESTLVHLTAAATAGVITCSCTNPIWVVRTRLQLSASRQQAQQYRGALDCVMTMLRQEGIRSMYKGLSASYLGVAEGTIQWTLYEKLKSINSRVEGSGPVLQWVGMLGSAGTAKCVASLITYPHEVLRTRLRQPVGPSGIAKYHGLIQTLRIVIAEEGVKALYGGLSAHLMRVVPNAAVMYSIYEGVLHWGQHK